MKNKIALFVYRLAIFVFLFCLFLFAYWGIQRCFKDNGNVKVKATNVGRIYSVSASGMAAYLYDYYYFPANEIVFTDEVEIGVYSPYGSIQYQDSNGNWVDVDFLKALPKQNTGKLVMTSLPGRIDYTIGMACLNNLEDVLSFPCSMQYRFVSESKFEYTLTAPYMTFFLYFQDDEHPNENDEFFIEFELENCTIFHQEKEITGPLRLFAWNNAESKLQGDIWSRTEFAIASPNGSSCIIDTFSGSVSVEDMPAPDTFLCTFANEIDAILEGNLSFRYGSHSSDYNLFSERVYLHADGSTLEEEKKTQIDFLRNYLNFGESGAWFSVDPFEPNLVIESSSTNKTRITTFECNYTVDNIELNGVSLFPNIKTFFVDNAMNISVVSTIIIAVITYVFPTPEKFTFDCLTGNKKRGGKRLKK